MDPFLAAEETRYIDVFMRGQGSLTYTLTPNVSYVNASNSMGDLGTEGTSRALSVLSIDGTAVSEGHSAVEINVEVTGSADASNATVILPLQQARGGPRVLQRPRSSLAAPFPLRRATSRALTLLMQAISLSLPTAAPSRT